MHKSQNRIRWNRIHLLIYIESVCVYKDSTKGGFCNKTSRQLGREARDDRSPREFYGNLTSPPTLNDAPIFIDYYSTTNTLSFSFISCYDDEKETGEKSRKSKSDAIYFYIICSSVAKKRIRLSDGILLLSNSEIQPPKSDRYTLRFVPLSLWFTLSSDFNSILPLYFPLLFANR